MNRKERREAAARERHALNLLAAQRERNAAALAARTNPTARPPSEKDEALVMAWHYKKLRSASVRDNTPKPTRLGIELASALINAEK